MMKSAGILKLGLRSRYQIIGVRYRWTSSQIRKTFVDYFIKKDHIFVPSSSVIPKKNDGSYFVNSGMNQFKPMFLGTVDKSSEMASYKKVTNYQKCIRVGGKHNDLEDVGRDHHHHTFFEMLGNWSFDDYGKVEACKMAWDLLTKVFQIPEERLFVTYFKGDKDLHLPSDIACKDIWLSIGVPESRILPFGMKENFWLMGETGPCGPCSEIHYCHDGRLDGRSLVNADNPNVVEIWNLVFMEFDRMLDGTLKPLPQSHIDTGMGLERVTAVLQGKTSNYDTDLFEGIFSHVGRECGGVPYKNSLTDAVDRAYRIVADHSRMFTVAISDGLLPARKESEGKLRQIMYRCLYQANEVLHAPKHFIGSLVPIVVRSLGEAYPNLLEKQNLIMDVAQETEQRYLENVIIGRKMLSRAMSEYGAINHLSGEQVLRIYEGKFGRGVSYDIISLLASEFCVSLDEAAFKEALMKSNKVSSEGCLNRRSAGSKVKLDQHDLKFLSDSGVAPTTDLSHETLSYNEETSLYNFSDVKGKVVALKIGSEFVDRAPEGTLDCGVILDATSFYAEGGGQVADIGKLLVDPVSNKTFGDVTNVARFGGYIVHRVSELERDICVGDASFTRIDAEHRTRCAANHTATHVIHYALNQVLGSAQQQGSSVSDQLLTFDFTCRKNTMTTEDLKKVVKIIRQFVEGNFEVKQFEAPLSEVINSPNLLKLENEVYPNKVKVIAIGSKPRDHKDPEFFQPDSVSLEFCGGTHASLTGHLKDVVITNLEGSLQGTKRLTAVTRDVAREALDNYAMVKKEVDAIEKNENAMEVLQQVKKVDRLLSTKLLPRLDRELILERMKKINFDVSRHKGAFVASGIANSIKEELSKASETQNSKGPVFVIKAHFEKSRDAVEGLLSLDLQHPVFLLSKSRTPTHIGVVFVPKDFLEFHSSGWADHVCKDLGGQQRPPRGRLSKHDNISLFSIPATTNRKEEVLVIERLAKEFLNCKEKEAGLQ